MLDIRRLAEQRKAEFERRQFEAINRWKPYMDIVEKYYKEEGKQLHEYQKANIAQCCDNLFDFYVLSKMNEGVSEATTSDAIAFARQMLPTIPALLPSLVSDHVAIVQAIDRPQAQVYYMNVKAATTKGDVTAEDRLIGARTGHAAGEGPRGYASDTVYNEANIAGTGAQTIVLNPVNNLPIIDRTVIVNGITVTEAGIGITQIAQFRDSGAGLLQGYYESVPASGNFNTLWPGVVGTYVLATGVITLDAGAGDTVDAATPSTITYRWNVESYPEGIGGIDMEVTSSNVDAMVFPLKLNYNVFSAILLQKVHGFVLADEGMKFATQEIRFSIDQIVLQYALAAAGAAGAATSPGNFDTAMGASQEWIWRIHQMKRYFSKASANIFAKTLRAQGNVIVGGINVCSLIEQLPEYKPAAGIGTKPPAGPYVHGTLGTRLVICNPFYDADTYVMLFRGDSYLYAGLIFAPYVPLYATDPITLADLTTQRGFMSMAAIKRINDGMFTKGTITNY